MNKLYQAFLPVAVFARIDIRRLFRDKLALFFVFLLPLLFLFILGGVFGRDNDMSFSVALLDESRSEPSGRFVDILKKDEVLKVDEDIRSRETASDALFKNRINAIIILPENFGTIEDGVVYPSGTVEIIYKDRSEKSGLVLTSVVNNYLEEMNESIAGRIEKPFTIVGSPSGTIGLSSFDYLFPGLLGFTILGMGLFGPTTVFPRMKQKGVLKRYQLSGLRIWQFILGNALSVAATALLAVAVMILVALTVPFFDLQIRGNLLEVAIVVVLGTLVLFSIGIAIGGWAKNERQAAPLSNAISFPMMLLSGTFFPRYLMPEWLQNVSEMLPLTQFIDSVRMIMAEGKGGLDIAPHVGILLIWGVVGYFIALKVFRWG